MIYYKYYACSQLKIINLHANPTQRGMAGGGVNKKQTNDEQKASPAPD
jgi:hypothetical protein